MERDEVEVHKHERKERSQYPAILTQQAWSIKDLLYGIKHLAGQSLYPNLARLGSQSQRDLVYLARSRG